tara:strand:+ start:67581 stop:68696 length:1116 start_codon:yes stop_codon:yes gene_type:complete
MPRFIITCALGFCLAGSVASAQDAERPQVVCTVAGCSEISLPKPRYSDASAFSVQNVWTVIDDILAVSGLSPNFQVVETEKVENAAAVVLDGERYLAFNPDWMAQYKTDQAEKWRLYGVIAHEVGHHLQGHTITGNGSRPPTELEADEYAGFTLAALGASLEQSQSLWVTLSESGSATHPPRHQRLAAVERGWIRRNGRGPAAPTPALQPPPPPPPPGRAMRNCVPIAGAYAPANLCFSSYLAAQGANTYLPRNTQDGNPQTSWVEGVAGHGIGEHFSLVFTAPTQMGRLELRNGYAKSARTYSRNSRVRALRITTSHGDHAVVSLRDTSDWQDIPELVNFGPVSWAIFEIADVYPGTHYQDTAITEISYR